MLTNQACLALKSVESKGEIQSDEFRQSLIPMSSDVFKEANFESDMSRSFETKEWKEIDINGFQPFKKLVQYEEQLLWSTFKTHHFNPDLVQLTLKLSREVGCLSAVEFCDQFKVVIKELQKQLIESESPQAITKQPSSTDLSAIGYLVPQPASQAHAEYMSSTVPTAAIVTGGVAATAVATTAATSSGCFNCNSDECFWCCFLTSA